MEETRLPQPTLKQALFLESRTYLSFVRTETKGVAPRPPGVDRPYTFKKMHPEIAFPPRTTESSRLRATAGAAGW